MSHSLKHKLERGPWHSGLVTTAAAFCVYLLTIAPDVTWANFGGDGSELAAAAYTLGVPHPPGYPTFVLLGKLFSLAPIGTIAFRINLMSAAAAAFACGILVVVIQSIDSRAQPAVKRGVDPSSIAAGLTLAFAPLVWGQAVIAEVYALNLASFSLMLWAALVKRSTRLTGVLLGLTITTHLTSILALPLIFNQLPKKTWPTLVTWSLVGLAPLLAVPFLAAGSSPVVWGEPTTLSGWWWLVSGDLYRANVLALPFDDVWPRLLQWLPMLLRQFTLVGSVLLIIAIWRVVREGRVQTLLILGTALLFLVYAFGYAKIDAYVLLLPALLLLVMLLAPLLRKAGWLALMLPLLSLLLNFSSQDLSGDLTIRLAAESQFQAAPESAVIETPGDSTIFAYWYFQHVEGKRPDLVLVDSNLLAFDWYRVRLQRQHPNVAGLERDDLASFRRLNMAQRPYCLAKIDPEAVSVLDTFDCTEDFR